MKDIIVITGPTASGKTDISIEIALSINAEIINADSMQVYKQCNIGTAKPSKAELAKVKHHLIDFIEPFEEFSTARYKELAVEAIKNIMDEGKRVVITGGTGLYIDALVNNIDFSEDSGAGSARERYRNFLKRKGKDALFSKLEKRDRKAAEKVHPNNTRRVIRYLEILDGFDGSLEEYMKATRKGPSEFRYHVFVLWPERDYIYKRIEKRVDIMLETGLVDEVRGLFENGLETSAQSMQGIGYKETIQYIHDEIAYDEFVELLKRNTRRYAKRQFTWMNRYSGAVRIPIDENTDRDEIVEMIKEHISKD